MVTKLTQVPAEQKKRVETWLALFGSISKARPSIGLVRLFRIQTPETAPSNVLRCLSWGLPRRLQIISGTISPIELRDVLFSIPDDI